MVVTTCLCVCLRCVSCDGRSWMDTWRNGLLNVHVQSLWSAFHCRGWSLFVSFFWSAAIAWGGLTSAFLMTLTYWKILFVGHQRPLLYRDTQDFICTESTGWSQQEGWNCSIKLWQRCVFLCLKWCWVWWCVGIAKDLERKAFIQRLHERSAEEIAVCFSYHLMLTIYTPFPYAGRRIPLIGSKTHRTES